MAENAVVKRAAAIYFRPEFENPPIEAAAVGDVARRLTLYERIVNIEPIRKFTVLLAVIVAWELYTRISAVPELIFPTFSSTAAAFVRAIADDGLLINVWNSVSVLLTGYALGIAIAGALVIVSVASRFGSDLLTTLTAMLNPLPAIALLPMAMIWFGLGTSAIVFTLLHSIVWPVALNTHSGFQSVSETLRMVGRNYGLKGVPFILKVLIPAAFPSILTGLKIGWAFAWRTLIAAELVFGGSVMDTSGGNAGGLGWMIFQNQMNLRISHVFAGLFTVILVGVIVESVLFRAVEERTVRRWGMQQ
jgi:NitT/TauT family transport system permease protein